MRIRQLRGYVMRLFGLFDRERREREFAEELESHLAFHIEDNLRAGMSKCRPWTSDAGCSFMRMSCSSEGQSIFGTLYSVFFMSGPQAYPDQARP